MVPFVDLRPQYETIKQEVDEAISQVVSRGNFVLGSEVSDFEQAFCRLTGTKHGIGVGSGLDALRLTLAALRVGAGDEVIVPANTYIATALAVSSTGARPVFVDCEPATYNIDHSRIQSAISAKTRAIIPVHLTGQPADMNPILEIADQRGLTVIEDACQAHGASYHKQACGSLGRAGCFSFYPGKNLGAFGDGGLITTDDDELAGRLRQLRNYGQRVKYEHVVIGVNSRLDTIQAAVLAVKLRYLDKWNEARRRHAAQYRRALEGVGDIRLQSLAPNSTHIYHLYVIETEKRDELQQHLNQHGIQTGIHYPIPVHLQEAYSALGYRRGGFPVAEKLAKTMLSLPMFPELSNDQIEHVVSSVRQWFGS